MTPRESTEYGLREMLRKHTTPDALNATADSLDRDAAKLETMGMVGNTPGTEWAGLYRWEANELRKAART